MAEYKYKYPNESFSGCDMTASIVYSWNDNGEVAANNGRTIGTAKSKKNYATHTLGEIQTISYSIHMEKRPVRSIGNVNAKDYVMGPRTIAGSLVFAVFNRHFAKNIMAEHNKLFTAGQAFLVDELPPFNVVVSFANEYGLRSKLVIYGVRLLNEGQVMSINDVFTENTYQFVATDLEYLNDEISYESRDNKNEFLKINDTVVGTKSRAVDPAKISEAMSPYNDSMLNTKEDITLSVITVDATRNNPNGRATFSLSPLQTEGYLTITDSNNDTNTINITGAGSYSIMLPPDMYSARFTKSNPSQWKCNSRSFNIKEFREPFDTKRYAPIIEVVTDTTIQVYSNETTHTHVSIKGEKTDMIKYHEIKNRRVKIKELERNQVYEIATCNGPETLSSPTIKVRTFTSFDKPFNDFKRMIETNRELLQYKVLDRYYEVLNRAKEIASSNSNYQSPTDSIILLKQKYEAELNSLDKEAPDYNDKRAELTNSVHVCNELIYLSNKIHNNTINSINKETPIDIPEAFFDEAYNNCFAFSQETTKAEFYRVYKGVSQFSSTAQAGLYKEIEGNENSFMYSGKSGVNHFVQALREHVRSPKLEFYSMTVKEKQDMIDYNEGKDSISEQAQDKINATVQDELGSNINNSAISRAFMRKVKTIDNPLVLDPEVISKNPDSIEVITIINNLIALEQEVEFYLSVAKKSDITSNDFIYKKRFTNKDESIILDDIDFALFGGYDYALWIEDEDFNQISNVTTFNMSTEEDMNDRLIFEYELNNIIRDLKRELSPLLPGLTFDSFCSFIEYNEEITKTNIINKTIEFLLYSGLGESVVSKCLSAINLYIGPISETEDILENVTYSNNILSFDCEVDSTTTLIMSFNKAGSSYHTSNEHVIDTSNYNSDYILVSVISSDLKIKSKTLFINRSNNTMEVL